MCPYFRGNGSGGQLSSNPGLRQRNIQRLITRDPGLFSNGDVQCWCNSRLYFGDEFVVLCEPSSVSSDLLRACSIVHVYAGVASVFGED